MKIRLLTSAATNHELGAPPKQFARERIDNSVFSVARILFRALGRRIGKAMEKIRFSFRHSHAGVACVSRDQLLARFARNHRYLAKLAAVEHFFTWRRDLDSHADELANHPVLCKNVMAAT